MATIENRLADPACFPKREAGYVIHIAEGFVCLFVIFFEIVFIY